MVLTESLRLQNLVPYSWVQAVLMRMSPEQSHYWSMRWLNQAYRLGLTGPPKPLAGRAVTVAGLEFPNPVGLAAGLDKNGTFIDPLGSLGFGFIEVGTVTPLPQPGNPLPRLFRLKNHRAIINRMGFNNQGLEAMMHALARRYYSGPVGANIGKNKNTPHDLAINDYKRAMSGVFPLCDYVTVNISSPNTKGLRDLQREDALHDFLHALKIHYLQLTEQFHRTPPLFLKVAPDLDASQIHAIATAVLEHSLDGLVVSNTTLSRDSVEHHFYGQQAGGLSGAPLRALSTEMIRAFRNALGPSVPIIGVGGIFSVDDAREKLAAGAQLIQIYTSFIYEGPPLVKALVKGLTV